MRTKAKIQRWIKRNLTWKKAKRAILSMTITNAIGFVFKSALRFVLPLAGIPPLMLSRRPRLAPRSRRCRCACKCRNYLSEIEAQANLTLCDACAYTHAFGRKPLAEQHYVPETKSRAKGVH